MLKVDSSTAIPDGRGRKGPDRVVVVAFVERVDPERGETVLMEHRARLRSVVLARRADRA